MTACLSTIDAATRDSIGLRRNALAGMWAGRRMGLKDDDLADYVAGLIRADQRGSGTDHLVRRLWTDLDEAGVPASATEILVEISRIERSVRAELLSTD